MARRGVLHRQNSRRTPPFGVATQVRNRGAKQRTFFERLEQRLALAFGLTTTSTTYTVDTGANVVFSVLRQGTSSTVHSGDLTSFKYNGVEFAAPFASPGPQRYSHFESGLSNSAVVTATVDPAGNWIKITCDDTVATVGAGAGVTGVIQYYIAKKNDNAIYMATYAPQIDLVSSTRFITYLNWSKFPNHPLESDTSALNGQPQTAIENIKSDGSGDVYQDPVTGYTHSKYYGENRLLGHVDHGATGPGAGAFMFIGSRESGSGGPFWKDIDFQSTGAAVEMYNIPYSDHSQTEAFRPGLHGPYALVLTGGSAPSVTPDYTFLDGVGLTGWVSPSARGSISGTASGVSAGHVPTVALANGAAQYWATPDSVTGAYSVAGVKPGIYTETLYQDELAVGTQAVTITAGSNTTANIASALFTPSSSIFQIGAWDGTPLGFLNADKITIMHPSDPRLSPWADSAGFTNFTVGADSDSAWPMAEWQYQTTTGRPVVDLQNRITFTLTVAQASTLRIGLTRLDHGRPIVSVNGGSYSAAQALASQPGTRGVTLGNWRGNNVMYTYSISTSSLHAGTNTIDIKSASGSGSGGDYLSPYYIYDAIDLVPTSSLTNVPKLNSVSIVPTNSYVPLNGSQSFVAIAKDQFGNPMPFPQQAFTWSTTLGSINSGGLYTAGATSGSGTIMVSVFDATLGSSGTTKTATINVFNNAAPTVATAASATPNPAGGTSTSLSVLSADDFGESNLTYTWAATGTPPAPINFSANGTNAAKNIMATFSKAGTYSLLVTVKDAGNLTTTSSVSATVNQTVTSITLSPPSATVVNNNSQQFSATAFDQFSNPVSPAPTFTWSLDSPSVGSVDSVGFYSAPSSSIGPAVVRAAAGATSGAANVNVVWLKGDIDGDGQRTVKDMFAMMSALGDLTTYQTNRNLSPTDLTTIADIDNDTAVTNLDLQALVNLLAADAAGGGSAGAIGSASISPLHSVATPTVPNALGGVPGAATESTTASLPLAPRDGSQERNAEISNLESGIAVHAVPSTPYSGLSATAVVRELPALAERPFYPPIRSSLDPLTPISLSARDYIYANIETPTNSRRFIHRSRTPDSADDLVGFPLCPKGEREGL